MLCELGPFPHGCGGNDIGFEVNCLCTHLESRDLQGVNGKKLLDVSQEV